MVGDQRQLAFIMFCICLPCCISIQSEFLSHFIFQNAPNMYILLFIFRILLREASLNSWISISRFLAQFCCLGRGLWRHRPIFYFPSISYSQIGRGAGNKLWFLSDSTLHRIKNSLLPILDYISQEYNPVPICCQFCCDNHQDISRHVLQWIIQVEYGKSCLGICFTTGLNFSPNPGPMQHPMTSSTIQHHKETAC